MTTGDIGFCDFLGFVTAGSLSKVSNRITYVSSVPLAVRISYNASCMKPRKIREASRKKSSVPWDKDKLVIQFDGSQNPISHRIWLPL